jgi:hypothetical protein
MKNNLFSKILKKVNKFRISNNLKNIPLEFIIFLDEILELQNLNNQQNILINLNDSNLKELILNLDNKIIELEINLTNKILNNLII